MTANEFFRELLATSSKEWTNADGMLRMKGVYGRSDFCPITFLTWIKHLQIYAPNQYRQAANVLGLEPADAESIARSSDGTSLQYRSILELILRG
ncbi:MAG: hypothetical protein ACRDF4_08845 [Rhabdochlamydiaceae bacterium]